MTLTTVDMPYTPPTTDEPRGSLAPKVFRYPSPRPDHAPAGRSMVPVLDTSDDPTGAAFVWPVLMLAFWAVAGLGSFLLLR